MKGAQKHLQNSSQNRGFSGYSIRVYCNRLTGHSETGNCKFSSPKDTANHTTVVLDSIASHIIIVEVAVDTHILRLAQSFTQSPAHT